MEEPGKRRRWAVVAGALLGLLLPVAALQLPPKIRADRYPVRAKMQIEEPDYVSVKESIDRVLALREQQGLEIPEPFLFRHAEVVERLGLYDWAVAFETHYLTLAGREGEPYREALCLLNTAEAEKGRAAVRNRAEQAMAEGQRPQPKRNSGKPRP